MHCRIYLQLAVNYVLKHANFLTKTGPKMKMNNKNVNLVLSIPQFIIYSLKSNYTKKFLKFYHKICLVTQKKLTISNFKFKNKN